MPKPTGKQWVTLYRGLAGVSHPDELDPELIGPHWTHDPHSAEMFAGPSGSVVEADVPAEHILYNGKTKESHKDFDEIKYSYPPYIVMPEEMSENETFVKPGVPINIRKMSTHPENTIRDKWEFNPPITRSSEKLFAYGVEKHGGDVTEYIKGSW